MQPFAITDTETLLLTRLGKESIKKSLSLLSNITPFTLPALGDKTFGPINNVYFVKAT